MIDYEPVLPELKRKAEESTSKDEELAVMGKSRYQIYGSTPIEHNNAFAELIKPNFSRWVEKQIQTGQIRNMFEVMGNGTLLRSWGLPGLFTELTDSREPGTESYDRNKGINCIFGHILDLKTVNGVNRYLADKKQIGFDLIVCRPAGGVVALGDEFKTHRLLIARLVNWLAINGSLFYQSSSLGHFNQRNREIKRDFFETLARSDSPEKYGLQTTLGIETSDGYSSVMIKRLRREIPRLPLIKVAP